jgi:hypothetical protein
MTLIAVAPLLLRMTVNSVWASATGAAAAAGLSVFAVAVAYTGAVSQLVVTLGLLAYGAFVARFALGTRWPRILAVVGLTLAALGLFAGPFLLKVPVVEDALRFFSIGTHAPAPFCTAIGNRLRQFYWTPQNVFLRPRMASISMVLSINPLLQKKILRRKVLQQRKRLSDQTKRNNTCTYVGTVQVLAKNFTKWESSFFFF